MNPALASVFLLASMNNGLPAHLLDAVCGVESNHSTSPTLIRYNDGKGASYGICQIKVTTARQVGFRGRPRDLMDPKVNIEYAARYLAFQLKRYGNDYAKSVTAYNQGTTYSHGGSRYLAKVFNKWVSYEQSTQDRHTSDNKGN